jgi:peptide/nickel transport system permease protein
MLIYLLRRFVTMAATILAISALVFIIKLPGGDYLTNQIEELRSRAMPSTSEKAQFLRAQYGLDKPVSNISSGWACGRAPTAFPACWQGDWGWSFEYQRPVRDVVGNALLLTLVVNLAVVIFIHLVAIPIALFSAVRQYSTADYLVTFWVISGSPRPISCWRSFCCSTSTAGSASPSAA